MTEQDILKFIKGFKEVKDFFLYGYCYWFAKILEDHFGGIICYLPVQNHFVTRIKNVYYDANGKFTPDEEVFVWSTFQYKYPHESQSIIRGCIDKTE